MLELFQNNTRAQCLLGEHGSSKVESQLSAYVPVGGQSDLSVISHFKTQKLLWAIFIAMMHVKVLFIMSSWQGSLGLKCCPKFSFALVAPFSAIRENII